MTSAGSITASSSTLAISTIFILQTRRNKTIEYNNFDNRQWTNKSVTECFVIETVILSAHNFKKKEIKK